MGSRHPSMLRGIRQQNWSARRWGLSQILAVMDNDDEDNKLTSLLRPDTPIPPADCEADCEADCNLDI